MMSTEPSFDEDVNGQANDSIITKVKSRVSNIFPSVANWFSSPGPTNNGSVRRRRETDSDDDSEEEPSNDELPQSKRRKSDVLNTHQLNTPSTSSNARRLSMPVNSTPAAQLMRNRNLQSGNGQQPQQMTSSPYDFASRNPSMTLMASPIQINDSEDEADETDEVQLVQQEESTATTKSVTRRKGIHETQYNVLRISSSGDRSTSEPPTIQSNEPGPSRGHRYGFGLQNEVIPENETGFERVNGNNNDEGGSEASEGIEFNQPVSRRQQQTQGRMSGFLGNRNKSMSASTGQLSFQAHLETEKSLFSEQRRQFNPSVYGSSWSLNSGGSGSRLHRNFSPFYGGKTMFGGAAAYSRRDTRMQQMLRVPTMIRPSSRLSNASSNSSLASIDGSNASNVGSNATQQTGLSNTSKRILELLNQCTSPLKDARKMGTGLNTSMRVPSLLNNSGFNRSNTRFNESDLDLSRKVRLTQPKTPYSRPTAPLPPTSELQVPSISQLLQMKRMLNSTAQVKQLASQSKSTLNEASEYTLPGQELSSTKKYTNKVKEKLTNVREKPVHDAPEPVNLPNIQFPSMKNVPKIDITVASVTPPTVVEKPSKPVESQTTSDIIVLDDDTETSDSDETSNDSSSSSSSSDSMKFKFSSPVPILSKPVPSTTTATVNSYSRDSSRDFKFSAPLTVLESLKPDMALAKKKITQEPPVVEKKEIATAPELKQGSCLDALFGKKAEDKSVIGFGSQFKMASSQWECDACMVRNDNTKESCVACNSPKPGTSTVKKTVDEPKLQTTDTGFAKLVAAQSAKWSCPTCMSQNDQSADKCLACTEPKPGAVSKPVAKPGPAMDDAFKKLVDAQKAKWQCPSCCTQNEQTRMKCACCEEAKPGTAPEKVPAFSFNSGSTGKFSFGVPKDVSGVSNKDSPKSTGFVFGNKPSETEKPAQSIMFGVPAASATTVTKADTGAKPAFSFGVPNSTTKSTSDMVSSSTVNNKPAVVAGGFSFGVTSSVVAKSEAISSAADTSSNSNKRQLDEPDTAKPTSATPTTLTFGKTNEAQAKSFSPASTSNIPSTNNTVSSSGGFAFQKTTSVTTVVSEASKESESSNQISSTAKTNAITAPIFGSGFSGIKPLDRSAFKPTSTADDTKKNTLIFGAAKKDEGIKPSTGGFTFGQSSTLKPADTSSIFGGAKPAQTETNKTPGFAFMSSPAVVSKPEESKPTATPTFGMFGNAQANKPSGFSFGGVSDQKTDTASKPVFGSFGAPTPAPSTNDPSKSIFGSQSTSSATTPFVFGSASTSNPPPAYNSQPRPTPPLSGNNTPTGFTTPLPTPSNTNIFGSVNSTPSVFEQTPSQENKLPAFGATNAFGATTPSPFGGGVRSASSANSPFGSVGTDNEEPHNKKLNTGFQFNASGPNTTSTGSGGATPFLFGGTPNLDNNNSKGAFSFSPQVKPTFNFSENPILGSNSATATNVPFQFGAGSSSNPPPGVFTFGATPVGLEQPQNQTPSVFEFGASNINNNASNTFAPGQSVGMQQRRKIKATRRIVR